MDKDNDRSSRVWSKETVALTFRYSYPIIYRALLWVG